MQLNQSDLSTIIGKSDVLQTYARRLARLVYLKHVCDAGHPVLSVECDLIEIARENLQAYVKKNVPNDSLWTLSPQIISHIKSYATHRIMSMHDGQDFMNVLIESLNKEDLSNLIPVLN